MIQTDRGSLILVQITPRERTQRGSVSVYRDTYTAAARSERETIYCNGKLANNGLLSYFRFCMRNGTKKLRDFCKQAPHSRTDSIKASPWLSGETSLSDGQISVTQCVDRFISLPETNSCRSFLSASSNTRFCQTKVLFFHQLINQSIKQSNWIFISHSYYR